MKVDLFLIGDPVAITNQWSVFVPGFRQVLAYVSGEQSEASIYNDLASGRLGMLVIMVDDKYGGFLTFRLDRHINARAFFTMVHMHLKPGIDPDVIFTVQAMVTKLAKERGCEAMRFFTERDKAFERKLHDHGWNSVSVEMVKEI